MVDAASALEPLPADARTSPPAAALAACGALPARPRRSRRRRGVDARSRDRPRRDRRRDRRRRDQPPPRSTTPRPATPRPTTAPAADAAPDPTHITATPAGPVPPPPRARPPRPRRAPRRRPRRAHRWAAALPAAPDDPAAPAWRAHHRALGGLDVPPAERVAAAEALARIGRGAAALAVLGDGDDPPLRAARAEVLLAQGHPDAARAALGPIDGPATAAAVARLWTRAGQYRRLVDELDPTDAPPPLRLAIASARLWLGELDAAAALAAPLVADPDPHIANGARHALATVAWQQGRLAEATTLLDDALAATPDDARALRADLLRTLGGVRIYRGALAEAEAPLLESIAIAEALGRLPELAKGHNNLGILRYQRGDWAGARAAFEQYQLLCGRVGSPVERANVANNLGQLALCLGEPERALTLCDRAIALCEAAGYPRLIPVARSNRGAALTALGRYDEAAADFAAAAAGLDRVGGTQDRVELDRRRVELTIARGDWGAARKLAEALYADPITDEIPVEAAQVRRLLAECAVANGEIEAATAHADAAVERFEALECTHELATARETRARVMVATGKFESAILECRRALLVHRALGARGDADRTTGLLSEAEEHYRHSTQSVRHAEILLELSMTLGATHDPEALLRRALEAVAELVDAERGLIALDAGEIVTHGLDHQGPGHPLPVSESIVAETRRTGRAVVVQDAIDDGVAWTRTSIALLGLRSILCVPVRRGDAIMGVLYLDSSRLVATDLAAEVELMSSVARLIGVAVENARLLAARAPAIARIEAQARALEADPAAAPRVAAALREIAAALRD
ncbi:MAG: GAF domain-containing protein [bacterium]